MVSDSCGKLVELTSATEGAAICCGEAGTTATVNGVVGGTGAATAAGEVGVNGWNELSLDLELGAPRVAAGGIAASGVPAVFVAFISWSGVQEPRWTTSAAGEVAVAVCTLDAGESGIGQSPC